jgi:hypothetical protein
MVTGASLAGLAAYLYLNRPQPSVTEPPVKFTNRDITLQFIASLPDITPELNLELATCQQVEIFTQTHACSLLWGHLDLGTNLVQVSVPVTYRYHIHLRDEWKLEIKGQRVIVHAPALRAASPPAINTDQLTTLSVRGWGRRSPEPMMQELKKQITPRLTALAADPRRLNLVRDTCRKSVAEFIRLWLEREHQRDVINEIQVLFPAEKDAPTLRLQE